MAALSNLAGMYLFDRILHEEDLGYRLTDNETARTEAVRLLKMDLEMDGHESAYYKLGCCYCYGWGVPIDRREAARLWRYAVINFDNADAREELEENGMDVPEVNLSNY